MESPNLPVPVGVCLCPGAPHEDGDSVYLRPKLDFMGGIVVQQTMVQANRDKLDPTEITGLLMEAELTRGIVGWTLVDDKGEPVPVNADTIRTHILSDFSLAAPLADRADDLYTEAVLGPLLNRAAVSSNGSSTKTSTSANPPGQPTAARRSRRSSTSTTPTDATAPTSA